MYGDWSLRYGTMVDWSQVHWGIFNYVDVNGVINGTSKIEYIDLNPCSFTNDTTDEHTPYIIESIQVKCVPILNLILKLIIENVGALSSSNNPIFGARLKYGTIDKK